MGVILEENEKLHRNYRVTYSCCSLDEILTTTTKRDGMEGGAEGKHTAKALLKSLQGGERTWWHFAVEKLHSTCQPGEIRDDVLLLSQQCNSMLSFLLCLLNYVPKKSEIHPELCQIEVNFNTLARMHKPSLEK